MTGDEDAAARLKTLALRWLSADAWRRFSDEGYRHYEVVEPGFQLGRIRTAATTWSPASISSSSRLPCLVELAEEPPEALVPAVDASSHDVPECAPRVVPLEIGVVEGEPGGGVTASHSVVDPAHDLDVLL